MNGLFVFMVGAAGYSVIEVLWRGYTHWTMSVTGGACMFILYCINSRFDGNIWLKCLIGAVAVTAVELVVGIVVNIILGWNVWDYSEVPLNFKGQICASYSALWFLICLPVFKLCDFLSLKGIV